MKLVPTSSARVFRERWGGDDYDEGGYYDDEYDDGDVDDGDGDGDEGSG